MDEALPQHPDSEILLSFPGLGTQLAARLLAEIGDDHSRFVDACGLKAYAGCSPITRASGKKSNISVRCALVASVKYAQSGATWAVWLVMVGRGCRYAFVVRTRSRRYGGVCPGGCGAWSGRAGLTPSISTRRWRGPRRLGLAR
ncbi:IS110 family transposase [Streptomyces sp. NBC_01003]|uniref:transposase n=1 Tax=Streptomyces sp. NBC_01003 TaxID=2903714 RepID=UPI0038632FBF|nr:IS110 family transposase [Streptomyces sp. NBC_01003]